MANYKAYFRDLNDKLYRVELIKDASSSVFTEVLLAGENPFVVQYNESESPFEPVRTSTASINIVHNNYLQDILSDTAQETQVKLWNDSASTIEWCGYLTPKIFEAGYEQEYETFSLEAADCISSLQYLDYEPATADTRAIVTFKNIIDRICTSCGLLVGYYWPRSKKVGNTVLLPDQLKISEMNFYSTDTDEPWKLNEMLEEICRYVGVTCLQWKDRMYFIDYQYYHSNNDNYMTWYAKASSYQQGTAYHIGSALTVTSSMFRGADASVNFEPVYNKCVVKANMNTCEYYIPDIFADNHLTNRIDNDDFYANYEVKPESPTCPSFPTKLRANSPVYSDDADDINYRYFHRTYDNKYYDSVYHTAAGAPSSPSTGEQATSAITRNYMGGTIVDLGVVKKEYLSDYQQFIVPSKLDYTRYLCLCCKYNSDNAYYYTDDTRQYTGPFIMYKLKDGYKANCFMSDNSYLVLNYSIIWERYVNRAYINPDWSSDECGMAALAVGQYCRRIGNLICRLGIGDKYWNGSSWTTNSGSTFKITCERSNDNIDSWNQELGVLNNVKWDMFVDEEGYKIPLSGTDLTDAITFEIQRPDFQFMYNSGSGQFVKIYEYNAYCWLKDFSIKCVETNQSYNEECDVTYENVINEDAVNELSDISCRITTYSDLSKPSYSTVAYYNGTTTTLLTAITETNLSGNAQKPEENIVEKYVSQYNSPTKALSLTLDMTATPFNKYYGMDVESPSKGYIQLGTEIDYATASQTIKLIEKK